MESIFSICDYISANLFIKVYSYHCLSIKILHWQFLNIEKNQNFSEFFRNFKQRPFKCLSAYISKKQTFYFFSPS